MYLTPRRQNSIIDEIFKAPFFSNIDANINTKLMRTDVQENEGSYVINMDIPGVEKEDIQVELKDGYMTVAANRSFSNEEKDADGKFIRKERFEGSAKRSFYVGDYATEENVKASFTNGVLRLEIPKEPEEIPEPPKRINIEG